MFRAWAMLLLAAIAASYAPLFASASSKMACCNEMHTCCKKARSAKGLQLETYDCCVPCRGLQKATVSGSALLPIAGLTLQPAAPAAGNACRAGKHSLRVLQFALLRFQRPPPVASAA